MLLFMLQWWITKLSRVALNLILRAAPGLLELRFCEVEKKKIEWFAGFKMKVSVLACSSVATIIGIFF